MAGGRARGGPCLGGDVFSFIRILGSDIFTAGKRNARVYLIFLDDSKLLNFSYCLCFVVLEAVLGIRFKETDLYEFEK